MSHVLIQRVTWRSLTLIGGESGLVVLAVAAGIYVHLGGLPWVALREQQIIEKTLLVALMCQLCLYYGDVHHPAAVADKRELLVRTLRALGSTSTMLGVCSLWVPALLIGPGVFVTAVALLLPAVMGWRIAFDWLAARVGPRERILLVGTDQAALRLARELDERPALGVHIVGFVDADPARVGDAVGRRRIVGTVPDIPNIVSRTRVDRVVVGLADARGRLEMTALLAMKLEAGISFDHLASVYEEYTGKIAVENLRPSWLIFSSGFQKSRAGRVAKRGLDVVVASVAAILLAPVVLLVAAVLKVTSPGPVLYQQERVGQHGRTFRIHKFRSMHHDAEAVTGAIWARPRDPRVTAVGRILRRTRLDELPQLWNVLRGEMSLVGPRPERPVFVEELTRDIPFYGQRHTVKPGVTGWAQVRYSYGATVEDAMEKLHYDLFYVKNMSLALDVYILVETVKTVMLGRGVR